MKKKTTDTDIDFIGGQGPLTKEEEQALSEYFRSKKNKRTSKPIEKAYTRKRIAA